MADLRSLARYLTSPVMIAIAMKIKTVKPVVGVKALQKHSHA